MRPRTRAAGDISIQVPVNMRKYCPSHTLRNFSMYFSVRTPRAKAGDAQQLLPDISHQLAEGGSEQSMRRMLASTTADGAPFELRASGRVKAPPRRACLRLSGRAGVHKHASNLGAARLPENVAPHVRKLDFVLGTGEQSRAACAMVTLGRCAVLSVTKLTEDKSFETRLWNYSRRRTYP